ncbi:MAG: AlpA family phage regulatory protein [Rhodomicrobium sp.]
MRLLHFDELKTTKGIRYSPSQLWRKEKDGSFPRRIKLGAGAARVAWAESEIDTWISERMADRDRNFAA